jgi:hypothetical protein
VVREREPMGPAGDAYRTGLVALASLFNAFLASVFFAGVASADICPNEALRSELRSGQLPDCRAYEQVTPVYKEGQIAAGNVFAMTPDGSHVLATSFGSFAGTGEDRLGTQFLGATYVLSRTQAGWHASAVGPPVSGYVSIGMLDTTADLAGTLWGLSRRPLPGEENQPEGVTNSNSVTDFYIERGPGSFVDVGPPTPDPELANRTEYIYLGGSEDLSHVLYSTKPGFHWPFDSGATESSPLYEYVGIGNKSPMMVGVTGGEGSDELVSQCGTRLGSSEPSGGGSMYNAISNAGDRVFFTAVGKDDRPCGGTQPPVNQLLVREELPGGEMHTAAISEPSVSYCSPPPPATPPPCAGANFQGASRDGSKVFFISSQKLLPGASEGSPNLYEDELIGSGATLTQKLVLVSEGASHPGVQGVARVSEDGASVYFVASGALTGAPNSQGYTAAEGEDNLYAFERDATHPTGHVSYLATLSPGDARDWQQMDSRPVQLSSDGHFLVFPSQADLTHEATTPGVPQIYQYESRTGLLVRASIGQNGFNNNGRTPVAGSSIRGQLPVAYTYASGDSPTQTAGSLAPADGAVFFESPDALTPQALSDQLDQESEPLLVPNIYEYRSGTVYLISDGRDASDVNTAPSVYIVGSSASGEDLLFATANSLIPADTDTQHDLYDARVGGGVPTPLGPSGCEGEACRGALSRTPLPAGALAVPAPEGSPAPIAGPVVKPMTNAQKLARALKACRAKHNRNRRRACESQARKRYGPPHTVKKFNRRGGR